MPQIDPTKINKKIKDKYSVVSNAFRLSGGKKELTKDGKPKDLIITEVGDVKQTEFYPQVKIGRWGDDDSNNEVNLSLRLLDGGHTYKEVFDDIQAWAPKARKIVCGHDYNLTSVRQAVQECFGEVDTAGSIWIKSL